MSVAERPPASAPSDEQTLDHPTPKKVGDGVSLSELIQRARNASGEERAWLCTLINRALIALSAATDDKDRQAALLLEMLDDEALHGLEDEHRLPCRAVAVEALLAIGYPWALQLEPEDVQFLRDHPARPGRTLPLARIFSGAAGAGAAASLGMSAAFLPGWWSTQLLGSPTELALAAAMVLTTLSSFGTVLGGRPLLTARWLMGLAGAVAAAVVVSDAVTAGPSLVHLLLMVVPALGLAGAALPRRE